MYMTHEDETDSGDTIDNLENRSPNAPLFVDPIRTLGEIRAIHVQPDTKYGRSEMRGQAFRQDREETLDEWSESIGVAAEAMARRGNGLDSILTYFGRYNLLVERELNSPEAVEESTVERLGHAALIEGSLSWKETIPAVAALARESAIGAYRFKTWPRNKLEHEVKCILRNYHPHLAPTDPFL